MNREFWRNELEKTAAGNRFGRGYKLLYCPWETLDRHRLVFLSLNPGARTPLGSDPAERLVSDERGNSYEFDRTISRSPMSEQFLRLCGFVNVAPAEVLTGVMAPFRSGNWEALTKRQREASMAFGRRFWSRALQMSGSGAGIVVCSRAATKVVVSLLGASLEKELESGWGTCRLRRFRTGDGRLIVGLPHLSRFRLFSRTESEPHLGRALADL